MMISVQIGLLENASDLVADIICAITGGHRNRNKWFFIHIYRVLIR
jgi:hypothetical protein